MTDRKAETTEPAGIHKAIIAIMREIGAIGKERENLQQKYLYRGIEDVYNRAQPLFATHGIYSVPNVVNAERSSTTTKSGGTMNWSVLTVEYTFHHEDGSSVTCTVVGEGMDPGDKSSNKALAAAHKYAICQILNIPYALVDPDQFSPEWLAAAGGISKRDWKELKTAWWNLRRGSVPEDEAGDLFLDWVTESAERQFDGSDHRKWTEEDLSKCKTVLHREQRERTAAAEKGDG